MLVLPWQKGHMSEVLMVFDNTIANITTALQVGYLHREQAGVGVQDANDDRKFAYRLVIGESLYKREEQLETNSKVQILKTMMQQRSSGSVCVLLSCPTNCAVRNAICRRPLCWKCLDQRDGIDGCLGSPPVAAWYGVRYVTTELD